MIDYSEMFNSNWEIVVMAMEIMDLITDFTVMGSQ